MIRRHGGLRGLACATISQALKDMRREGKTSQQDYTSGVIWLASTRAAKFFDTANIDQEQALLAMEWSVHAEELWHYGLNDELSLKERRILRESLWALKDKTSPNQGKTTS